MPASRILGWKSALEARLRRAQGATVVSELGKAGSAGTAGAPKEPI